MWCAGEGGCLEGTGGRYFGMGVELFLGNMKEGTKRCPKEHACWFWEF